MKYYDLKPLIKKYPDCEYYMIYGEKSNGKTYAINAYCLERYLKTGEQSVYIRRTDEDLKSSMHKTMFSNIFENMIKKKHPEYSGITNYRRMWFLVDKNGKKEKTPFMYEFSLNAVDHTNGSSLPNVKTIFFDEFASRTAYLQDEYRKFQIVISNIIRERGDVTIFMAGNTVNKFCPYFKELDFKPDSLQQGEKILIKKGRARIAVEYTKSTEGGKASDKYFFSGKSVSMITKGAWEVADYPACPERYTKKDVVFSFYIIFDEKYITGDLVKIGADFFIFFHPKKEAKIKHPDYDMVFCDFPTARRNYSNDITTAHDDQGRFIIALFQAGKVFYSDGDTGEILRNFIMYSISHRGIQKFR